jgi:hypothetical protein
MSRTAAKRLALDIRVLEAVREEAVIVERDLFALVDVLVAFGIELLRWHDAPAE